MRTVLLAVASLAAGCIEEVDARWQLDHDHVLAARATPPRIAPGEMATLDALIARDGALTSTIAPDLAAAPLAPTELGAMVRREGDGWVVEAPAPEQLATMRPAMGLSEDAPVPIELVMTFPRPGGGDPFYVKKTVWLGERAMHPLLPQLAFDGAAVADDATLELARERDIYVQIDVPKDHRVNWYTSCGTLFQDDVATAFLRLAVDESSCEGELAVVVRAPNGGVAWRVWPLRAQ